MNSGIKLKLSRQTVLLFFVAALTGILKRVIIIYICVLFHELAHLCMCYKYSAQVEYIGVYPYGMELRLKEMTEPRKQIFISLAGPMVNLLFFVCGFFVSLFIRNTYLSFFVSANLILFVFNMMPCIPLDGGEILRSFVSGGFGILYSYTFVKKLSKAISVIMLVMGIVLVFYNGNFSLFPVFVIIRRGIILKGDEQIYAVKKILSSEFKSDKKIKIIQATSGVRAHHYLRYISYEYTLLIIRQSSFPVCQKMLLEKVKNNPSLYIDDI